MSKLVGIINYNTGNIYNINHYLQSLGFNTKLINRNTNFDKLDGLVLPGIGSFNTAMDYINKFGYKKKINLFNKKNKPILGVCLGFQIMFRYSNENKKTYGLNFFEGEVKPLKHFKSFKNQNELHIGWNKINYKNKNFKNKYVYFVHKFAVENFKLKNSIIGNTKYNKIKFLSLLKYKNILGTQFHPERSDSVCNEMIFNFLNDSKL